MNILADEILPLFDDDQLSENESKINTLINSGFNEYTLYVNLEDVYHRKTQDHIIKVNGKNLEYNIPIFYHKIVLSGKGHNNQDLIIQIKTLKHEEYYRLNNYDLLKRIQIKANTSDITDSFSHLNDEEIVIDLDPRLSRVRRIPDRGLSRQNGTRGYLYLWLEFVPEVDESIKYENRWAESDDPDIYLLDILNYDNHSNIIL